MTAPIDSVISAAKQARAQQLPGWDDMGCVASMRISWEPSGDRAALIRRLRGTPGGTQSQRMDRVRGRIAQARAAIMKRND